MKLSEAIRKGAALRPRCKSYIYHHGRSCVIGAAAEGYGMDITLDDGGVVWRAAMQAWPELAYIEKRHECPCARCTDLKYYQNVSLADLLVHLNDDHGWTRERIAAWLDLGEYKKEEKKEEEPELVYA